MNKTFRSGMALVAGSCICIASLCACAPADRNIGQQGNRVAPQQGIDARYGTRIDNRIDVRNRPLGNNFSPSPGMPGALGTEQGAPGTPRMPGANQNVPGALGMPGAERMVPGAPGANGMVPGTPGMMGANRTGPRIEAPGDAQKARNIEQNLRNIQQVERVGVLVAGNTAIVGIDAGNIDTDTTQLKTMIADRVKGMDRTITNCVVTESPDIMERAKRLTDDMINNRRVNEISKEVNRMLRQVTPVIR